MAIGRGQFTIIDYNDVNISTTEPSTKAVDMLWLDSSVVPNQLKRWNGSKWDIVSDYQIGGRNLLRNTSQPVDGVNLVGGSGSYSSIVSDAIKGNVFERALTTTTEGFLYTSRTGIIEPSTQYTLSFDLYASSSVSGIDLFWLSDIASNIKTGTNYVNVTSSMNITYVKDGWQRITWTFTTKANDYTGYIRIDNNGSITSGTNAYIRVTNIKLEKGNKATDWTPAPEDVQAAIDAVASRMTDAELAIGSDNITATVRNNVSYMNDVGINRWLIKRYNYSGGGQVIPTPALINNIIPSQVVVYQDVFDTQQSSTNFFGSNYDSYIGVATTFLYCDNPTTITLSNIWHDDSGSIYLNDVSVYAKSGGVSTGTATLNLLKGWNKLDLMWTDGTSGDGFRISTKLSTNANITKMSCYHNIDSVSEARMKIASDEIDLKVSKDGVVASINASPETGVTINANKINLVGAVTISTLDDSMKSKIDTYDKYQVGGRNLFILKNVGSYAGGSINTAKNMTVSGYRITVTANPTDIIGGTITNLGTNLMITGSTNLTTVNCYYKFSNGTQQSVNLTVTGGKFVLSLPVPSGATSLNLGLGQYPYVSTYYIENIKVENGTLATDFTPSTEDTQASITSAATDATNALNSIADMSSDSKITPVEKNQLKKEWATISAEKPQYEALGTTFNITTEKTNYVNAYNTLNTALNGTGGILLNMTTTSTVDGTTFRNQFDDYYDKKSQLIKKINELNKTYADNASKQGYITTNPIFSNWTSIFPSTYSNWGQTYVTISTTLSAATVANATSITVTSATNIAIGTSLTIGSETRTVTGVSGTTITLNSALLNAYASAAAVTGLSDFIDKETTLVRDGLNSIRFNVTSAGVAVGAQMSASTFIPNVNNYKYVVVELDFMLTSGSSLSGAGVLLDWTGMTDYRSYVDLNVEVPSPILNKWYSVRKVVQRKSDVTTGWTGMAGYLMANYSAINGGSGAGAVKNIIFDKMAIREATQQEIDTFSNKTTWDRASNINSNGTIDTSKLNGSISDTQIASATTWNGAKDLVNSWKTGTIYMNGGMIGANTIFAQQIAIGDFTNLCQINEEKNPNGNTTVSANSATYFKTGTAAYAKLSLLSNTYVEFLVNDEYYLAFNGYRDSGMTTLNAILRYFYSDGTWSNAGTVNLSSLLGTTDSRVSGTIKVTAGPTAGKTLTLVELFLEKDGTAGSGYYYVRDIEIRKKYTGTLLVDGSITANKITTSDFQAVKIGVGNGSPIVLDGENKSIIVKDTTLDVANIVIGQYAKQKEDLGFSYIFNRSTASWDGFGKNVDVNIPKYAKARFGNGLLMSTVNKSVLTTGFANEYARRLSETTNFFSNPANTSNTMTQYLGTATGINGLTLNIKKNATGIVDYIQRTIAVTANTTYTLSFDVTFSSGVVGDTFSITMKNPAATNKKTVTLTAQGNGKVTQHYAFTFATGTDTTFYLRCDLGSVSTSGVANTAEFTNMMLCIAAYEKPLIYEVDTTVAQDKFCIVDPNTNPTILMPAAGGVEMWLQPYWGATNANGNKVFVGMFNDCNVWVGYQSSTKQFVLTNASGTVLLTSAVQTFVEKTWVFIAVTWDASNVSLYLNGALCGTAAKPAFAMNTDKNIYIGCYKTAGYELDGIIDELHITKATLTAADILRHYNSKQSIVPDSNTTLKANFDSYMAQAISYTGVYLNGADLEVGGSNKGRFISRDSDGNITTVFDDRGMQILTDKFKIGHAMSFDPDYNNNDGGFTFGYNSFEYNEYGSGYSPYINFDQWAAEGWHSGFHISGDEFELTFNTGADLVGNIYFKLAQNQDSNNLDTWVMQGSPIIVDSSMSFNKDITINKTNNWSKINFTAQQNDAGFIGHYEYNNTSQLRFVVSDDQVDTDYLTFGTTPGGNYYEAFKIGGAGNVWVGKDLSVNNGWIYTGGYKLNGVAGNSGLYSGNGDNANYSTFNVSLQSWWGIAFNCSMDGATRIIFDTRNGNMSTKGDLSFDNAGGERRIFFNTSTTRMGFYANGGVLGIYDWTNSRNAWYYDVTNNAVYFDRWLITRNNIIPENNNVQNNGRSGNAWAGVYAYGFNNTSDRKEKYMINDMQTSYAYDIVKDMKPYMYRYNQPKDIDTTDDVEVLDQLEKRKKLSVKEFFMGIMADEAPIEILNHENEKSINIYSFATLLLGALQENMKNVEELKEVVRQLGGVI